MFSINTIMVLSPHTDDGEIGAGGNDSEICRGREEDILCCVCEASVPKGFPDDVLKIECKKATNILEMDEKERKAFRR